MITKIIQYLKKEIGAGTVNAIAAISTILIVLLFIWSFWAGKIDNVIMFASGAFAYMFISGMIRTINTPQN